MISSILAFLFGSGATITLIVMAILANPEKAEKWFALFWKFVVSLGLGINIAHKKYVQHDIQGSVNEFVKIHAEEMPGFQVKGVKLEWVDADIKRQSFLEADRVVVRVKRDDPRHENFVKAVFLFVSTALLYRAKRYISPPQGRAIDLFVSAEIFKELNRIGALDTETYSGESFLTSKPQRPLDPAVRKRIFDHFLEQYLHPQIDDGSAKVTELFEAFDLLSKSGVFFPVFLREMDYLGEKVFGRGRHAEVVTEVYALIEFLRTFALRRVGDEQMDLNFIQKYCRCAIVIVGKPAKVSHSISPYVNFVREKIDRNTETIYLLGRAINEEPIKGVCSQVSDLYELVAEKRVSKVVLYGEEKRQIDGFVAVLRSRRRQLYAPVNSAL